MSDLTDRLDAVISALANDRPYAASVCRDAKDALDAKDKQIDGLEASHAAARENFLTMQGAANELRIRAEAAEARYKALVAMELKAGENIAIGTEIELAEKESTITSLREEVERLRTPKVKPLVWRVPRDDLPRDPDTEETALCADGIGGVYAISKKQKAGPERLLWWANDPYDWKGFATIDEAKAAAQQDYETRVRSALGDQT